MYTIDFPRFIVSNQKEESISIQRVNCLCFDIYGDDKFHTQVSVKHKKNVTVNLWARLRKHQKVAKGQSYLD